MYKHSEYQQVHAHDDLIPKTRRGRNDTPWPFRYPLLVKISISTASSPTLSGNGMVYKYSVHNELQPNSSHMCRNLDRQHSISFFR